VPKVPKFTLVSSTLLSIFILFERGGAVYSQISLHMNKRERVRFQVNLKCRLQRPGTEDIEGETLNMSRSGALIKLTDTSRNGNADCLPNTGEALKLVVPLPVHSFFGPRCIWGEAIAVRRCNSGGECTLALRFEQVEIRRVEDSTASAISAPVM